MRIVLIIDSLAGGGAEKVVLELARALIRLGHDAVVVSLMGHSTYEVPEDVPVFFLYPLNRVPLHSRWKRQQHARDLMELLGHLRQTRGDLDGVISNLDYSHYIVSACQLDNAVYVVHNAVGQTLKRAAKMGPFKWLRQRRLFRALHGQPLIAVSQGLQRELEDQTLFRPQQVSCIYNPFDFDAIRHQAAQPCADIPDGDYLLHVGRFAKQKRHDLLFAALQRLPADLRVVCLGSNPAGIRKLAIKMGVSDRVITPGFQQNPYPWYKQAACLVLCSDFEGFGNVLVEAMSCGTPVVATDCPHGPSEILIHEQAANLVPPGDVNGLANRIQSVLKGGQPAASPATLERFDHLTVARQYQRYLARFAVAESQS